MGPQTGQVLQRNICQEGEVSPVLILFKYFFGADALYFAFRK